MNRQKEWQIQLLFWHVFNYEINCHLKCSSAILSVPHYHQKLTAILSVPLPFLSVPHYHPPYAFNLDARTCMGNAQSRELSCEAKVMEVKGVIQCILYKACK